eukprot:TRINITY_DN6193_c0_g2_i1.p1 TRINITY_DN6193_c0_g2~~TRINITY_DN6193_c0_g2_i1.p1  ORF type:complete len:294 (+),score=51.81 TRINITY_DN6193_c0_g2_i1:38-919(+)
MATELSVVNRLLALSGDVANQPYIARRGILPTLKRFMTNGDIEVQLVAAKTLRLLASHPDNPDYIAAEAGMVQTVLTTYDGTESADLKAELEGVMAHLKAAAPTTSASSSSAKGKKKDGKTYPTVPEQHKKQLAPRTRTEKTKIQRRHMLLKAPAVNSANVDDLEHLLQNIRGMISYSIDTQQQTLNLFLSTPKHILLKHLKDVGFECEVLEEQIAKAHGATGGSTPSYLSSGQSTESDYKRSLVATGEAKDVGSGSLAARLKEQHKNRNKASAEEKNSVTGFFTGLARNLLS